MDWTKLFEGQLSAIEKSFQVTADSLQSCRSTVYLNEMTQKSISDTLKLNQNLSIKKILDHAAIVIHENITSLLKFENSKFDDLDKSLIQHIYDFHSHSIKICFFSDMHSAINGFILEKINRKTFVMSKRSESLYRYLESTLNVSFDIIINCVFIGYFNHLSGKGLDIYKTYASFMDEYQEIFYKIEELRCSPFIKHIGSFSCPEVSEIVDDIFAKYQEIEHIVRPAMKKSYSVNNEAIKLLNEFEENIPISCGYKEINVKRDYNEEYFF